MTFNHSRCHFAVKTIGSCLTSRAFNSSLLHFGVLFAIPSLHASWRPRSHPTATPPPFPPPPPSPPGIDWALDSDWSGASLSAAGEWHAVSLAFESLLAVAFASALLADEALELRDREGRGGEVSAATPQSTLPCRATTAQRCGKF